MADAPPPPDDFWSLLDEAEETVERWPEWQRRYVGEPEKTTKGDRAGLGKYVAPAVPETECC